MNSALYFGSVRHRRQVPVVHEFSYRLFMVWLDLDEIDRAFAGRWLWSSRHAAPAWFRRRDYLGDPSEPLADSVRRAAAAKIGVAPQGPIRMLTHLRYWGYVQNPVTFYYCFDPSGDTLQCVVAEITNTPWGERHVYVTPRAPGGGVAGTFDKEFHISPFMDMGQRYSWVFGAPAERLHVAMRNESHGVTTFDATLDLERAPLDGIHCAKALALHPWMTLKVFLGIYWNALRLRLKGCPFHPHPKRLVKGGTA